MYCSSFSGKKYFVMMVSKPITNAMKDTLAVIIVAKPVYDTLVILRKCNNDGCDENNCEYDNYSKA